MVKSVMIDQGKARAVNKTKILVIVSYKNGLGCLFNRLTSAEDFDPGPVKTLHKLNGRWVTDPGANQGIGLGEDKIRC